MKIKTKLLLALSVATIVPMVMVSLIMAILSTKQAVRDFENNSTQTLSAIEQNFSSFVSNIEDIVSFLATGEVLTDPQAEPFITFFEAQGKAPSVAAEQQGGFNQQVYKLFEDLGKTHSEFVYVYAADEQDGYAEWPGTYGYAEWHPKTEPWYDLAMNSPNQVVIRDAYYWEPDDAVYVTAARSFNRSGRPAGVVAVDFSIKTLMTMAEQTVIGETGSLMVIEDSGTILVDVITPENSFKKIAELNSDAYQAIARTQSGLLQVSLNDQNYYANVYSSPDLGWKFVALVPKQETFAGTFELIKGTILVGLVLLVVFILISVLMARRLITPIETVSQSLQYIAEGEGDLTAQIKVQSQDETGVLSNWFNQFLESTRVLIDSIKHSSAEITGTAEQTSHKAHLVAQATTEQQQSIDQIVSAGQQMVVASNDAAQSCSESAQFSEQALETTLSGKRLIKESSEGVNRLGQRLDASNVVIKELENETGNINQILSTIQDIAEQTNLLALNAAIEAARAGEQGRGFAVVADEVRSLAQRTQESTEQIGSILNLLSDRTKVASESMVESLSESQRAIQLSEEALNSFHDIEDKVKQMHDMTLRTAASAEEQRAVTEDINGNISRISVSAQEISSISDEVAALCHLTDELSQNIQSVVSRFRT